MVCTVGDSPNESASFAVNYDARAIPAFDLVIYKRSELVPILFVCDIARRPTRGYLSCENPALAV